MMRGGIETHEGDIHLKKIKSTYSVKRIKSFKSNFSSEKTYDLEVGKNYNLAKSGDVKQPQCPREKNR